SGRSPDAGPADLGPRAGRPPPLQAGGRKGGPARGTARGGGQRLPGGPGGEEGEFQSAPETACQTGRRTGRGTRATRSQRPRSHPSRPRPAATPPSTRLTHSNQSTIMGDSWFVVCGATFRWLVLVTAALLATPQRGLPEKLRTSS